MPTPKEIVEARKLFEALKDGSFLVNPIKALTIEEAITEAIDKDYTTNDVVKHIRNNLELAGADASALDLEGKKSAEQMEKELNSAIKSSNLREARKVFGELKESDTSTTDIDYMYIVLKRAGVNASALDPAGIKSAAQMEEEINIVTKPIYIKDARKNFEKLKKDGEFRNIEDKLSSVRSSLAKAGVDASALDPEGKKSAEQMEKELDPRTIVRDKSEKSELTF